MVKTISVSGKILTIQQLYPYQYNYGEGKEVLRIDILKSDHSYADIESVLENPTTDITYNEDGAAVCPYKGYTRDFKCSYANGTFSVEITKVTQAELDIASLKENQAQSDQAIAELSAWIAGGAK